MREYEKKFDEIVVCCFSVSDKGIYEVLVATSHELDRKTMPEKDAAPSDGKHGGQKIELFGFVLLVLLILSGCESKSTNYMERQLVLLDKLNSWESKAIVIANLRVECKDEHCYQRIRHLEWLAHARHNTKVRPTQEEHRYKQCFRAMWDISRLHPELVIENVPKWKEEEHIKELTGKVNWSPVHRQLLADINALLKRNPDMDLGKADDIAFDKCLEVPRS